MTQKKDLEKMMKWGKVLDTCTNVIGKIIQACCAASAVIFVIFCFYMKNINEGTMKITFLGQDVSFAGLPTAAQYAVVLLMAAVFALAVFMVGDFAKALRSVFQSMAAGRPFEEAAVKGFKRSALWLAIIGVLAANGYVLVMAAFLLLFSYVFSYGVILQTESDETL